MNKVYTMVIERDDNDSWFAELAEERRCHTWGRTLARTRAHMREAVALWFEVAPGSFDLGEDIRLPAPVRKRLESLTKARQREHKAAQEASTEQGRTAHALATSGLSLRDAADLMGLSHQRVQQILAASGETLAYELRSTQPGFSLAEERASYEAPTRQSRKRGAAAKTRR